MKNVTLQKTPYRKPSGVSTLVLAIEPLVQRVAPPDPRRIAAVLGGTQWLMRVWKRMAVRMPTVIEVARRASMVVAGQVRRAYAQLARTLAKAGMFRAVCMSFRS